MAWVSKGSRDEKNKAKANYLGKGLKVGVKEMEISYDFKAKTIKYDGCEDPALLIAILANMFFDKCKHECISVAVVTALNKDYLFNLVLNFPAETPLKLLAGSNRIISLYRYGPQVTFYSSFKSVPKDLRLDYLILDLTKELKADFSKFALIGFNAEITQTIFIEA